MSQKQRNLGQESLRNFCRSFGIIRESPDFITCGDLWRFRRSFQGHLDEDVRCHFVGDVRSSKKDNPIGFKFGEDCLITFN